MGLLYLAQLVVAVFVIIRITKMVNIFGNTSLMYEKQYDTGSNAYMLRTTVASKLMYDTVDKINKILINRQKNKFYVSSYTVEDVIEGLSSSVHIRVKAFISLHLVAAFVAIFVSLSGLIKVEGMRGLMQFGIYEDFVVYLATKNSLYLFTTFFILLFTVLLMSIEYAYWLFSQYRMNEKKQELISFIDYEFQDSMMDDIRLVLTKFSDVQQQMNADLEKNNTALNNNILQISEVVSQQSEYIKTYSDYISSLRAIKVEDLVVDTVKLQSEISKSLKMAAEYYPQFGSLSKTLNDTLNRTVTLYGQLNEAINRDSQFKKGIEVFNDNVRHNGHITAKLLETLNSVQSHVNQVVLVHGPKIEELDKEFFNYLEERLVKLRTSLEKNDEIILTQLNKINNLKTEKIKNEK